MSVALIFLLLFFALYGAVAGAIVWHLHIYAFSRSASWAIKIFITLAIICALAALTLFWHVPWENMSLMITNTLRP